MRITHDNKVSKAAAVDKHYTRCCQIGIMKVQRGMRHVSEVLKGAAVVYDYKVWQDKYPEGPEWF